MGEETQPTVLVVDDDDSIRFMVTRILQRENFHVSTAKDGQEAIEILSEQKYDVVLLDLMMPRVDGFGVIDFLREHQPETLRHLVVMTAFSAAARERVEPTCRVVPKPFDVFQLIAVLRECLSSDPATGTPSIS